MNKSKPKHAVLGDLAFVPGFTYGGQAEVAEVICAGPAALLPT